MVFFGKALGVYGEFFPSGGSKAKNPWGLRPLGFLALQLPRDNIHQDTPSAFPHIVSMFPCIADLLTLSRLKQECLPHVSTSRPCVAMNAL